MPLLAGFREMWIKRDRRAEKSVAGDEGIGKACGGTVPTVGNNSDVALRSGLRRVAEVIDNGAGALVVAAVCFCGRAKEGSGD